MTHFLVQCAYKSISSSSFREPPSINSPKPPSWHPLVMQQSKEPQIWKVAYQKKKKELGNQTRHGQFYRTLLFALQGRLQMNVLPLQRLMLCRGIKGWLPENHLMRKKIFSIVHSTEHCLALPKLPPSSIFVYMWFTLMSTLRTTSVSLVQIYQHFSFIPGVPW